MRPRRKIFEDELEMLCPETSFRGFNWVNILFENYTRENRPMTQTDVIGNGNTKHTRDEARNTNPARELYATIGGDEGNRNQFIL